MPPSKPSPTGLAIVICDQIIEDKLTGKKSLIGIFNQIGTQSFPCRHPQLCVFVSLTEGRGQCAARLRIVHDESEHVVAEVNGNIQFPNVHCDDALILERRFTVTHIKPPQGPPPAEL